MHKFLLFIFIIFSFSNVFVSADNHIVKEWYNFTIWEIDSIELINVPNVYLLDEKYVNEWNKIHLIKIKNYKVFSSDKTNISKKDSLYIYVAPSDKNFNIDDFWIWNIIIFRSDIQLVNNDFFQPLFYKSSILDLFYKENNDYIVYQEWIWYFQCIDDISFEIDIISNENKQLLYWSLAFINPNTFLWDKNKIPELEKNMVVKLIKESNICENWEIKREYINKENDNTFVDKNMHVVSENNKINNLYYIIWFLTFIIWIILLLTKKKKL